MSAPTFSYLFNTGSDIFRVTDGTTYPANNILPAANAKIGIEIEVLGGTIVKSMPDDADILATPDIDPSVSLTYDTAIPKDNNGNYIKGNYKITQRILSNDTSARTIVSVDVGSDEIEATGHGLITEQPVVYATTGTEITGLTNGSTYYVIYIDADTIQLATTAANAASGTQIDLTGAGTGTQTLTLAIPAENIENEFEYTFEDAIQCISATYDCLKPEFKVVDESDYTVDTVDPASTAANQFTIKFPVSTEPDFQTNQSSFSINRFYTQTQTVIHTTNLTYTFDDYTVVTSKTKTTPINVVCDKSLCNAFKCVDDLYDRWNAARISNSTDFPRLNTQWTQVGTIMEQVRSAYDCNDTSKIDEYIATLNDIAGCSGCCGGCSDSSNCGCDDCSGGGEPILVVGAGGVPNLTDKKLIVTSTGVTEYTWSSLIGLDYSKGDFNIFIDGVEADSATGFTITFDKSTGKVGFGTTVPNGAKFKFDIK